MSKNLRWKWIIILAVVAASIAGIATRKIRLGLDLKGGSHIVLQIQTQDAFKAEADAAIERLRDALGKAKVEFTSVDRNDPSTIESAETIRIGIRGVPPNQESELRRVVSDAAGPQWTLGSDDSLTMRPEAAARLRQDTLAQSMSTIEKKVNGLGVAEATVQARGRGESEILVQLPGFDDTGRVKAILQTSGLLELSEVKGGPYASREAAAAEHAGMLPLGTKLMPGSGGAWWLVNRSPVVTGRDLRNAKAVEGDASGRWDTAFTLGQDGARRFERFTGSHIGGRLAIVLDNLVISAPRVDAKISDEGRILGAGTREEASDLALNLRAGALPAGAKVMDELTVGPSLGADSIRSGVTAGVVGLALLIAAMLAYYRGAGINAVAALLLNTVMTIAALGYLETAWTLPGIAGLVLSIGMAVDSNVLIFERIKEELRAGKAGAAAVAAGFDRAFATIVDTHVTTVVASAFLFLFGAGPVRGFAVTLTIGLIANVFTAVFVSRAIFELEMARNPRTWRPRIGGLGSELPGLARVNFVSRRGLTLGIAAAMIVASIATLAVHGGPKYGLDFRGGAMMYVNFHQKPPMEKLRQALSATVPGAISLQESRSSNQVIVGAELADEQSLDTTRQAVERTVRGMGSSEISASVVGPRAGQEMRRQALLATACALGGMLAYVGMRFHAISGAAAVIATLHDVILTLGLFSLTGREIDLTVVAALLTLIGYSMNDKIVVLDRVRENLAARRRQSFVEVVNLSIRQTLGRTILTGGLTLLACLALYFLGGPALNGMAFAMCAGIVVGTYSSIFVASAVMVWWSERRLPTAVAPAVPIPSSPSNTGRSLS